MMDDWISRALDLVRRGEPAMIVTVCAVEGSAPRDSGAKMIVTGDDLIGSIGGGALELEACLRARALLAMPAPGLVFEDYPLGPALGQCCGGKVRIGFDRLGAGDAAWLLQIATALAGGETVMLETALAPEASGGAKRRVVCGEAGEDAPVCFVDAAGAPIAEAMPPLEDCAALRERFADERARVCLFGAGHVGRAMAHLFEALPVRVTWIDRREGQFPDACGANLIADCTDREVERVSAAPAGACYFVMTHDHQLDYELVKAILERGDAAYCGLIGSATKRARFERRLRRAGMEEARLGDLVCPIGGRGLQNKSPAVIALAAVYEMLLAHEARRKES